MTLEIWQLVIGFFGTVIASGAFSAYVTGSFQRPKTLAEAAALSEETERENYAALIEQYRKEVERLNEVLVSLSSEIRLMKDENATLRRELDELRNTRMNERLELVSEINSLQNKILQLEGENAELKRRIAELEK